MKKYLSKAAASLLAMTVASTAAAPVMAASYKDVPENAWYAKSVSYVTEKGIMNGVSDNEFAPDTKLTRGMIVTILYRLEGEPDVSAVKAFSDVPSDAYYADAVAWARENGIADGTGDGKFSPDNNVTREQLAKILLGYYTYNGDGPVGAWAIRLDYADLSEVSDWATEGIMFSTMKGLMQGKDGNRFDPKGETTRAEIAAVIERMGAEEADTDAEFEIQPLVGEPTDYSDKDNWLAIPEITHDVDTVYLYPTTFLDSSEGAELICDVDNEMMRTGAQNMYKSQATVYEESTNVFAPYYRQSNVMIVGQLRGDDVTDIQMREPRTDVYAALDYYFENYNNGRPFILAGHSQGSTMTMLVLGEYMQAHPEYYERMIAAYPIGFSITQEWLDEHPYAKFAEGADDTGVIVSWNTEGPGNKGQSSLVIDEGAISINPLNWKRDDTYAGVDENLGSLVQNEETGEYELKDGIADAQIDVERGVVVCTTNDSFIQLADIFGPESLHGGDYTLYYANIQKNVADRIAAYFGKGADKEDAFEIRPLVGEASDYSDTNNWLAIPEITHNVDTIYLYPTTFLDDSEGAELICDVDNEIMRTGAQNMYKSQATVYEESTNVFAPYYRQSNVLAMGNLRGDDVFEFQMQEQRTDVYAALDYYFENYNNGRPFILAGHSQGSTMTMLVLGEYMKAHPEYYERMIAAYPIGFSVTQKWLDEHPYAKFAEGADDTGVIVSWNTEGPGNKGQSSLVIDAGAISINPLNWKRDDTYAGVDENLGSLVQNEETGEYELADGIADAQIDTERGVVVCTTDDSFIPMADIFGPQSLHGGDYTLYYGNLQRNVADRINAYFAK